MEGIQRHVLRKINNDEYALVIFLDDYSTEFASELGTPSKARKDIIVTAKQLIKNRYPNLKISVVKVMIGGLAVASIPLMGNSNTAEAAATPNTEITQTNSIYYYTGSGDTLWILSQKFNTAVDHIKRANNLTSNTLQLNQRLIIPQAFHTVETGDYLTVLAKRYGVSVDAIREANLLTSDATRLGQILIIPALINGTQASTASPTQNESETTSYTVISGDSLSVIAKRFGTTVEALRDANKLTSDYLRVGQALTIPTNGDNTTVIPNTQTTDSTYLVASGDSLSVIAKRFGTTVDELRSANNLSTDILKIGQRLVITDGTTTSPSQETTPTPDQSQVTSTYKVAAGDSLWGIAQRFGTTVNTLKAENNLTSNTLYLGQVLTVSSGNTNTAPPPTPESTSTSLSHTVVMGESLWGIATRYGTSVNAVRSANKLTSDTLQIGKILIIPNGNDELAYPVPTPTPEPAVQENRTTFVYSVRSGDSLSVLAKRFSVTVNAIRAANNLGSDALQIGQALTIPNGIVQAGTNTITYHTHTVASGDNIWDLSVRYRIPQTELLTANNLTTSSRLSIGQKLSIPVHNIAIKQVVSERHGELLDWFTEGQYVFSIGKTAKVTDFATGKSFYIKRTIGSGHADSETLTVNDSTIAKSIWGGFSWTPRAVILEIDGRKIAASMSFMPHDVQYITNNGINGHFDVYTSNGIRHKDGMSDPSHQAQVERAAGLR